MKAIILVDNLTRGSLTAEWGLSIYIEYNGHKILLDTGASDRFARNAERLGLKMDEIEFGVLSHAHYDHANGMAAFFERNVDAPFYLREGTSENCHSSGWIYHPYIGIQRGLLKKYRERLIYAGGDYEVLPGVTLLPHKTSGLEAIGKKAGLYIRRDGRWIPDAFEHEQSLVLDTQQGLVICNSCSHGGADNIIREVSATWPEKKIYALIGGFHLFKSSNQAVHALADRIRTTGITKIYTGHCTGNRAFDILKEELGDRACQMYTGMEIVI